MHIISVGINYRKAPVQIREKFTIDEQALPEALITLRQMKSILECVIVATCNRTEIYAVVDQLHTGRHFVKTFMAEWFESEKESFVHYLDIKENDDALLHLFEVTAGLDSMVLGETQILGQVKDAFFAAQEQGTTGTIFNMLFKQVITTARRAHAETEISQHAVSVSYAAIELGKKIFGSLAGKSVLILGAGKMSELTVKNLTGQGVTNVFVVNRTFARAEELASKIQGFAYDFTHLASCLAEVDIVISSTGSSEYVIYKRMVEEVMKKRQHRPLFFIDIAVPRDLDPEIHDVENAFLYDIDDLNGIVEANLEERKREAQKIYSMIEEEMAEFQKWVTTLGVVPLISALRHKALSIQAETMQSMKNKLPDLDERELKVISKHTKSIINQLLRDPITKIKEMAVDTNSKEALDLFTKIFALEDELAEQEKVEQAKQQAQALEKKRKKAYAEHTGSSAELPLYQ